MIYRFLIDPLLFSSHNCVASLIQEGESILDIACGNGTLSLLVEQKTNSRVTGIDLDPAKIKASEKVAKRKKSIHAQFRVMDATDLSAFKNKEFDTAVISMAIHQFSPDDGRKVLQEAKRVANKIIILDYVCPMKNNFYKYLTYMIEWFAGREHYRNFRKYLKEGGLDSIIPGVGLAIKERQITGGGTILAVKCCHELIDPSNSLTNN